MKERRVAKMREQDQGVKWFNTVFYPREKTARAVRYEDGILPRLREDEIRLFTPWGPRYHWRERGTSINDDDKEDDDKEIEVLIFFRRLLERWQEKMPGKKFTWLFLGADLYGTKINKLPKEPVNDYFTSLRLWLALILPQAEFRLWSEFDSIAQPLREKIRPDLKNRLTFTIFERALDASAKMGGKAEDYLTERLTEAEVVETLYRPIKISAVGRHKDDGVDGNLPRLYLLPERLWAPWL